MHQACLEDCLPLRGRWLRYLMRGAGLGCAVTLLLGYAWWQEQSSQYVCLKKGDVATAKSMVRAFETALELYVLDNGRVPTTQQGLDALVRPPTVSPLPRKWTGPYLKDVTWIPLDPWNRPYHYQAVEDAPGFTVVSYGKDGRPGGTGSATDFTNNRTSSAN